jgi:nitroimidazol reductase NimA-like FMN-containing flavoprotein (pyridoxamine 5'-phosphate oxidase superfamily)
MAHGRELEEMSRDDCIKHMERHPARVGRIALAGPRPVIFPVNYVIDGESIIFRTDPGTKFHAAVHKAFVAFEVDWVEADWQIGWSVLARGQARVVEDPMEIKRLQRLALEPWAAGDKSTFVRIDTNLLSGRKLL